MSDAVQIDKDALCPVLQSNTTVSQRKALARTIFLMIAMVTAKLGCGYSCKLCGCVLFPFILEFINIVILMKQ